MADANGTHLLAYLMEMATLEAQDQLDQKRRGK
jgi:hypothetical protein